MDNDPLSANIAGVQNLVESGSNKLAMGQDLQEGIVSDEVDELDLPMEDAELLTLAKSYENKYTPYEGKITPRQKQNKAYLMGMQKLSNSQGSKTVPSNLLFEATATFVPQALAKNPEPVVFSDNTPEGKLASNDLKTLLQFHAEVLCLREKLGVMVWHWSVYFIAILKYGWDKELNEITLDVRKPANFLFDPDGYVDEYGDFRGWVGERCQRTAQEVVDEFPKHKEYISLDVGLKMGTLIVYTEWWSADGKYCFTTYKEKVLDKHKNEYFNYEEGKTNHFALPKMPYTFLSVFSLQEQPHDFTNLIEQNIANQDSINKRDYQIEKNLDHGNNAIIVSDVQFTSETAHQAADALEKGDPILASGSIEGAISRIPANALPSGILEAQERREDTLRSIYGTQGLTAQQPDENTTARGMILNQSHDSTRIGGGIGDRLETVSGNAFNWFTQLYYVFYDEKHYAAIMGQANAVEYVGLMMAGHERKYVVSVSPNSMQPKDELTQVNNAITRWEAKAIDPIGFMKEVNDADPMNSAKRLVLWTINPQAYFQQFFPEEAQQQQPQGQPQVGGQAQPEQPQPPPELSQEPASSQLSQVPLPQ